MEIKTLTKDNFVSEVLEAKTPTLVEFWAPWCVYCRRIAPVLDRLAVKEGFVAIGKVNVDEQPELEETYGVSVIPTLFLIKDGQPGEKLVAPSSQAQIEEFVAAQMKE